MGLANVVAGLEVGVDTFDSSMAGIGGCPFAPGATGNIVTEDLVFMLESMGLAHRHRSRRSCSTARKILAAAVPDEELYGYVPAAGCLSAIARERPERDDDVAVLPRPPDDAAACRRRS